MKMKNCFGWTCILLLIVFFSFAANALDGRVQTKEEAVSYLLNEVAAQKKEICMKADPALCEMLSDTECLFDVFSRAKIATADWYFEEDALILDNIVAFGQSVYCENLSDALNAFEDRRETVVLNLSDAFYEEFTENDFSLFFMLDAMAGIESKECMYYADTRIFIYDNLKYIGQIAHIESVEELKEYIRKCAQNLDEAIYYTLSERMFDMVTTNMSIEYEIYAVNGMYSYLFYIEDEYKMRSVKDIVYYPGTKIIRAVNNNQQDTLTAEEMRLYEEARAISEKVLKKCGGNPRNEMLIEKALIQEIAERCEYFVSPEMDYNTAAGALLYGKADCDGYADALYLVGNLSGLTIHYQLGNAMDGGSHMWNLVYADGNWHFTDPTGCDIGLEGAPEAIRPDWIGMGQETALNRYIYNPVAQMARPDAEDEQILNKILPGRVFDSVEAARAYLETCTDDWTQFVIKGIGTETADKAGADAVYGYGGPHCSWLWEDDLHVVLISTWFAMDHFYDCYSFEDVQNAFLKKQKDVIIRLSEEMYSEFLADGGAALNCAEKDAGVKDKQFAYYDTTRVFMYSDITYDS